MNPAVSGTRRGLAAVAALWLVVLGGVVARNEYTLRTGREVVLPTVPVDPRDLFRGDYVVLAYPMSTVDLYGLGHDASEFAVGQTVYAQLRVVGGRAALQDVVATRPFDESLFLRGQITAIDGTTLRIAYGIESYFVPEGKGRELEQARGHSLEVVAAVDAAGRAVIKKVRMDGKAVPGQ